MVLVADLHVHSRFSRATSQDLDFPALHRAALEKGLDVLGTGDFTHPEWLRQIDEQLVPAEDGLWRLREPLARSAEEGLPKACRSRGVRFILQVEISNIYKLDGRVRKNHNLVFVPSLDAARRLVERLKAIGNLASDGRPILGLDARNLLEITLESDPLAFLIPAHIWTPWFSLLGSMSGFDSIQACFRDLSNHIFAAETGLSSDPAMNWRVSFLDSVTLVSNSDAHSPGRLGREANLFDVEPSYSALLGALKTRQGFAGTVEFYPEEGKYHLDGHRKCEVRLEPEQTRELGGICPKCGGKLTVGVMHRVVELADRPPGARPAHAPPYASLVALPDVIGEALGVGAESRRAQLVLSRLRSEVGPELTVLREAPLEDIGRVAGAAVSEAVRRVRTGELTIAAGYDGEFGTVTVFTPEERSDLLGQTSLSAIDSAPSTKKRRPTRSKQRTGDSDATVPLLSKASRTEATVPQALELRAGNDPLADLDADQLAVAQNSTGPLLVVAGPGTGKTRTLVARIAHQVLSGSIRANQVLAVTFTNQAAEEVRSRLNAILPAALHDLACATTFHGFGLRLLQEATSNPINLLDDDGRMDVIREAVPPKTRKAAVERIADQISRAKQSVDPEGFLGKEPEVLKTWKRYEQLLTIRSQVDVDDLVLRACGQLRADQTRAQAVAARYRMVCVDEYQDVNDVQAALIRLLSPTGDNLCVIGDPDQAIYGFRGSRPDHFHQFAEAYRGAREVVLKTTYRLTQPLVAASRAVLPKGGAALVAPRDGPNVEVLACSTPRAEGEQILIRLERILGGTSLLAVDSGRGGEAEYQDVGFGDVAVLVRTKGQRAEILEALGLSGVPCHVVGEDDPHDPRSQKVAVMTMHASKGREFAVVFVAGVETGLMPLRIEGMETDQEEERRLLYVAMTRAKRQLVMSHCRKRMLFGRSLPGSASPFLAGLPKEVIRRKASEVPEKKRLRQLDLF